MAAMKGKLDVTDQQNWSPLHIAAAHPTDVQCLQELLKCDSSNVNSLTYNNETALLLACRNKHGKAAEVAVHLLLHYGADANLSDNRKTSPLLHAVHHGELNVVAQLLDSGFADPDGWDLITTPLHEAAKQDHLEIIKCLLRVDATLREGTWCETPIYAAAKYGHSDCLRELLAAATVRANQEIIDSNTGSGTALMVATLRGHTECVQMLLDHGANPNLDTGRLPNKTSSATALHMAVSNGRNDCLKLLLDNMDLEPLMHPPHPLPPGYICPVHLAVEHNHYRCLQMLLAAGFVPDMVFHSLRNFSGSMYDLNHEYVVPFMNYQTALSFAAALGRPYCMAILLAYGACIHPFHHTIHNRRGRQLEVLFPPILSALLSETWGTLDLLIARGVDISYHRHDVPSNECLLFSFPDYRRTEKLLISGSDPHLCFKEEDLTFFYFACCLTSNIESDGSQDDTLKILQLLLHFTAVTGPIQKYYYSLSGFCAQRLKLRYNMAGWNAILQQVTKPSPLQNLCRIKIRQVMISIHNYSLFREAIYCLCLPEMLKKFLLYGELSK